MTSVSLDRIADALGMNVKRQNDIHEYATVDSINADGSYQVRFNASLTTTRAAKLCDADAGDRVLCVISNGQAAAIGRVGGSVPPLPYIELLWTNQNPTSAFAAQDVPVPWQNYRLLIVEHYTATLGGLGTHTEFDIVAPNGISDWVFITSHREVWFMRGVHFPSNGTMHFSAPFWVSSYNSGSFSQDGSFIAAVPTRIWGVR